MCLKVVPISGTRTVALVLSPINQCKNVSKNIKYVRRRLFIMCVIFTGVHLIIINFDVGSGTKSQVSTQIEILKIFKSAKVFLSLIMPSLFRTGIV